MNRYLLCEVSPAYPKLFPDEAVGNVYSWLTGGDVSTTCALHCAWVVQGYCQSFIPDGVPPTVGTFPKCPQEMTHSQLAEQIKLVTAPKGKEGWEAVLVLLPLILEAINRIRRAWQRT